MKTKINYLFYGSFLLFLLILTFAHYFRMGTPLWGTPLFFLLYALGQALLEVLCFLLIGYLFHRWTPGWVFKLFIGLSFTLVLAHFANYTLIRLLDVSIAYFFKVFFGCGLDHFIVTFQALNMNSMMVAFILGTIIAIPLIGIAFYWLTQKVSIKIPFSLSQNQILGAISCVTLVLLALDIIAKPHLSSHLYNKYKKTLPLGTTFISPGSRLLSLPSPIASSRNEADLLQMLGQDRFSCANHPNIFLFVMEALRSDFINSQTAPNISAFAGQSFAPACAFSNANFTLLAWFSIFHADYPYHWTEIRDHWKRGSIPLQILKKLGYRIRVYSAADLSYFNMDEIIFGKNRQLADSVKEFANGLESCERDRLAINALNNDVLQESEGTVFIVFLDSTHSEYSAPQNFDHPFQPQAQRINYLTISDASQDLELLKNRYRNAIYWDDHLIGTFFKKLQEKKALDSSIIVLTGDHGEEFFEEGALFHGTHLNDWQTKVPLFYKIPTPYPPFTTLTTHLDIFPTILQILTGRSEWNHYFDGQSLFQANRWPYALSVQHNGSNVPYEFALSDGKVKLFARFLNAPLIYSTAAIELLSLQSVDGDELQLSEELIQTHFANAFAPLTSQPSKADLLQRDDSEN